MGLRVEGRPLMDGVLHRVRVDGDRGRQRSGAYVGHLDAWPAGYVRNHRTGAEERWRADAPCALRPGERAALAREAAEVAERRTRARMEGQRRAARLAARIWEAATPAASHPYLAAKGVGPHGLRVDRQGRLLVPVADIDGRLWGLQRIGPDGSKLFLKGARTDGGHMLLGRLAPGAPLIVAEGFATAATLREATGRAVAVAFNAHNLEAVARSYRVRDATRHIIIAGDDDRHLPLRRPPLPNVGRERAEAAAAAVRGIAVFPTFRTGEWGTDWNDLSLVRPAAVAHAMGAL
ncbi:toprim domain-containing protein (plasmid) [Roseomonas sp. CCTCC AB2023176]|uniref:toprim domain-containing protein n=1 Tax=Roseomonas sp. CCTCC AB2023176 TaxID=3342640 RepID=UPI0035D7FC37